MLRSAGSGWRCCALLIRADVTALCARSRGEPSSAHCEQRLSERLTPCPCEPVCACTGMRGQKTTRISARAPTRSAASRAGMARWAGEGGGRFGERREYEAPTLPSTPRQHGSARLNTSQARNATPPHKPGKKQHAMPTRHDSPPPKQAHNPGDSRKTHPVKMRMAARHPKRMKKSPRTDDLCAGFRSCSWPADQARGAGIRLCGQVGPGAQPRPVPCPSTWPVNRM